MRDTVVTNLSEAGKTIGTGESSISLEGMSYEDAHSNGYACGLLRLHIIDSAFDASASAGAPTSSRTTQYCGPRYASVSGYPSYPRRARGSFRSRYAGPG
jgi:hypothetical protein